MAISKKVYLIILSSCLVLLFGSGLLAADDMELSFPTNQKEIESALGSKKVRTRGLRTRSISGVRGVGGIVDDQPEPRVGAMINFNFDSASIRSDSYALLDEFGKAFNKGLREGVFIVAGHTDSKGTDSYNLDLSKRRAQAVADYLIYRHNIDPERLLVQGYGENIPIADNKLEEGRAKNRRVEFVRKK